MVSTVKQVTSAPAALTCAGLATLNAGTYVTSNAYANTNQQSDLLVELTVQASATPNGNQQVVLFAQASLDGTAWQGGPGSGATTTDEGVLTLVGVISLKSTNALPKTFSTAAAFGFLPPYVRFVVKNDAGVALVNSGLRTSEYSVTVG